MERANIQTIQNSGKNKNCQTIQTVQKVLKIRCCVVAASLCARVNRFRELRLRSCSTSCAAGEAGTRGEAANKAANYRI